MWEMSGKKSSTAKLSDIAYYVRHELGRNKKADEDVIKGSTACVG